MKITAEDLVQLKVCDHVIEESEGGAHTDPEQTAENISEYISHALERNLQKGLDEMLNGRYNRFRAIGEFEENAIS
jgi:acetyl-CoA carboxylase carboxyl transferase subunit alpha